MCKISLEMLKIYEQYSGISIKITGLSVENRLAICKNDCFDIEELLHDVFLLKNHNVTESFKQEIMNKLTEWCENKEVIDYIFKM